MKERGADCLVFSGGEPTDHFGLEELIGHAKNAGFARASIFSNGRRLKDRNYAGSLKAAGLDSALVSLHGPDSRIHDSVVGATGAFEETLRGIENLLDQGVEVLLNTVVSRINFQRLEEQVDFITSRFSGRVRLQLSDLFPTARVFKNSWLHVPYRELKPWLTGALIEASCANLACCTALFPLCVLDPFFMDALELREKERDTLVVGEDFQSLVWRKPDFLSHRYYLNVCRYCSLRRVCPGIAKSFRLNGRDRELFRPFVHLDPEGCLAANRDRDREQ